ncbi:folate/biopterin family MFS transporter [Pseudanabaena mucicola]|uniref:Folate/biopterin family MFS transporter n=1 Tax=Pseudanabaena mucicola FACHB-723 TaxID=2692860 RepID=A0ABR7ZRM9_9CYAN|nr:folate/biopterin family MFS transporter [Pseudanabaena mucicola]MBD2186604.1 folate/biopterin family MFS transporter [Pseudanabaena mucicola FACHB-723]
MLIQSDWLKSLRERSFDPELGAIAVIYFVQGAMAISQLAVSFFLKDDLGLSPAEVASMVGIAMLPWTVKPLYGLISDGFPVFGYRRRPYLLLSSVLGVFAWLSMGAWVTTPFWAIAMIATGSLSLAFSDAITDALIVQRARLEPEGDAGSLQSFSWIASSIGAIISAYLSGYLLEHFGAKFVFEVTATLPLLVGIAAFAIADPPMSTIFIAAPDPNVDPNLATTKPALSRNSQVWLSLKLNLTQLREAFTNKAIWLPAAFLFFWQATPSADTAFFYFTTNELNFNPEFLGTVKFFASWAGLLGVWLFQRFFRGVPTRTIFFWTTIVSTLLGLTSLLLVTHTNRLLGLDDRWFSLGDSLILTVAGRIAFMPVLVLAARLCPEGIEATLFALLMSVLNISALCSAQLGAGLTYLLGVNESNFDNLWLLVLIANVTSLLPLPLLKWLPDEKNVCK